MVRAAEAEAAHGEVFLVSGAQTITWAQFFGRLARLIPSSGTVSMTPEEARAHFDRCTSAGVVCDALRVLRRETSRREATVRARLSPSGLGRVALKAAEALSLLSRPDAAPEGDAAPIHPLFPVKIPMFASTARVRIEKAVRLLGYRPAYDFERGMALTEAWARWANLA
jgi:nucleoside-diphosphate-sugar epimerase